MRHNLGHCDPGVKEVFRLIFYKTYTELRPVVLWMLINNAIIQVQNELIKSYHTLSMPLHKTGLSRNN